MNGVNESRDQQKLQLWNETVSAELYEDLLNRYERVLVFAAKLQEKVDQQKLLAEKNESLRDENRRLHQMLALEQSYIRLLEGALENLGILPSRGKDSSETSTSSPPEK